MRRVQGAFRDEVRITAARTLHVQKLIHSSQSHYVRGNYVVFITCVRNDLDATLVINAVSKAASQSRTLTAVNAVWCQSAAPLRDIG
jgi:hypothetical protein